MYGEHIQTHLGAAQSIIFAMDSERYTRHQGDIYTINCIPQTFSIQDTHAATPVDFVIVATKSNGLQSALDEMQNLVDDHTIILSVMNGFSSEQDIADRFGDKNLIYCVALGMDVMREGTALTYQNKGRLEIGIIKPEQKPALEAVKQLFYLSVKLPST